MNKREQLSEEYEGLLFADGFDEAIIGVAERIGMEPVVAYSVGAILQILAQDMTEDEAVEYFEFNILGAYVGERTPVFVS
jgi:hypothetical protein